MESGITIDMDEFYGDVVEYNVANATESVIGKLCYRFNTAQRETWNKVYMSTYQDVIVSDDYDHSNGLGRAWSCCTYYLNDVESATRPKGDGNRALMHGNIAPEGYFYNAHMPIRVREDADNYSSSSAKYVNYTNPLLTTGGTYIVVHADGSETMYMDRTTALSNTFTGSGDTLTAENMYYQLRITVPVNYGFFKGDFIGMTISGLDLTLKFDYDGFSTIDSLNTKHFKPGSADRVLYAYWATDNVPLYAKLSLGERKFVWRGIVPPSEMLQTDEMYDTPFTNGRFYVNRNLNFFLKRQDPNGKYGLSVPLYKKYTQTIANPMEQYIIAGNEPIDLTEIAIIVNNGMTTCY